MRMRFWLPAVAIFTSINATINIIKGGKLTEKRKIELPVEYISIVKCLNPNCVTSVKDVKTRFKIVGRSPLVLRCHYCERIINSGEVEIL